ncbi:CPBP family intramembrane metalloprotease [Candidatus Saccharibacteria bacterium]|nr:MAG: CPBP family intramembrane metalloprotease [Candidatus Saccharibacteria bacterium]
MGKSDSILTESSKNKKAPFSWVNLQPGTWGLGRAFVGFIIAIVGAVVPGFILQAFAGNNMQSAESLTKFVNDNAYIALPMQYLFLFVLGITAMRLWSGKKYQQTELGLVRPKHRTDYLWAIGGGILFVLIAQLIAPLFPEVKAASQKVADQLVMGDNFLRDFMLMFAMAVGAPLGEDIVYRGIIMRGLYDKFSRFRSLAGRVLMIVMPIAISAVVFAMSHGGEGQNKQVVFLTIFGIIASLLYFKTGSFYVPVLAHSVCNMINIFLVIAAGSRPAPILYVFAILTPFISLALLDLTRKLIEPKLKIIVDSKS